MVVVSHDRWFLDRLSTHTLVLDAGRYPGVGAGADVSLDKKEKEEMEKVNENSPTFHFHEGNFTSYDQAKQRGDFRPR